MKVVGRRQAEEGTLQVELELDASLPWVVSHPSMRNWS